MVNWDIIQRLMFCFPKSFINSQGELIVHSEANEYFILRTCETETDTKCKLLEWLSRGGTQDKSFSLRT